MPGLRGHGAIPLSHSWNVVTKIGLVSKDFVVQGSKQEDLDSEFFFTASGVVPSDGRKTFPPYIVF